jgi:chitinase
VSSNQITVCFLHIMMRAHLFSSLPILPRYPVTRQGTPADYQNYPLLCEALRKAFDEAGQKDWVISVATTINPNSLKQGYAMVKMAQHIDWFNMMTYDIYGSWDSHAGACIDKAVRSPR